MSTNFVGFTIGDVKVGIYECRCLFNDNSEVPNLEEDEAVTGEDGAGPVRSTDSLRSAECYKYEPSNEERVNYKFIRGGLCRDNNNQKYDIMRYHGEFSTDVSYSKCSVINLSKFVGFDYNHPNYVSCLFSGLSSDDLDALANAHSADFVENNEGNGPITKTEGSEGKCFKYVPPPKSTKTESGVATDTEPERRIYTEFLLAHGRYHDLGWNDPDFVKYLKNQRLHDWWRDPFR